MADRVVGEADRTLARWIDGGELATSGSAWARYSRVNAGAVEYLQNDNTFNSALHEFPLSLAADGFERFFLWPASAAGWTVTETARHSALGLSVSAEHKVRAAGGDGFTDADRDLLEAIKAKTDLLGEPGMQIVVGQPVTVDGSTLLTLVRGDDYLIADSRQLLFSNTAGDWPDLTGATVKFSIRPARWATPKFTVTGTVIVPTGSGQQVRFELMKSQTGLLLGGQTHAFDVEATLNDGSIVTIVLGVCSVLQDVTVA